MNEALDGDYQTCEGESGRYIRENFFGRSAATMRLIENMTDAQIWALKRGGHDYRKVYAAYMRHLCAMAGRRWCWRRRSRVTDWAPTSNPGMPPIR